MKTALQILPIAALYILCSSLSVTPKTTMQLNAKNAKTFQSLNDFLLNDSLVFVDSAMKEIYQFQSAEVMIMVKNKQGINLNILDMNYNLLPKVFIKNAYNSSTEDIAIIISKIKVINKKNNGVFNSPSVEFEIIKPK